MAADRKADETSDGLVKHSRELVGRLDGLLEQAVHSRKADLTADETVSMMLREAQEFRWLYRRALGSQGPGDGSLDEKEKEPA